MNEIIQKQNTRLLGFVHVHQTPSECPVSEPMKGFANTFSNLTALSARVY